MKYKCKENDAIIELGKQKDELLIYINGEKVKTVIGLKDLNEALLKFEINNCNCETVIKELHYGYNIPVCHKCNKVVKL